MQITKEQIKALDPCQKGYEWYLKEGTEDLLETLLKVNKFKPDWAQWLYVNLMSPNQKQRIAIFAAEQVLHIFENAYPEDKRPRLAIEAAKAVLLNDTEENRTKARKAYRGAYQASHVIPHCTDAYYIAHVIFYTAYYVYYDAESSYPGVPAYYPDVSNSANRIGKVALQELILKEAVRILEEKE